MTITTLRSAIKDGRLEDFITEHEKDALGDVEKLDAAIRRPVSRKSKAAPKASSRDESGG